VGGGDGIQELHPPQPQRLGPAEAVQSQGPRMGARGRDMKALQHEGEGRAEVESLVGVERRASWGDAALPVGLQQQLLWQQYQQLIQQAHRQEQEHHLQQLLWQGQQQWEQQQQWQQLQQLLYFQQLQQLQQLNQLQQHQHHQHQHQHHQSDALYWEQWHYQLPHEPEHQHCSQGRKQQLQQVPVEQQEPEVVDWQQQRRQQQQQLEDSEAKQQHSYRSHRTRERGALPPATLSAGAKASIRTDLKGWGAAEGKDQGLGHRQDLDFGQQNLKWPGELPELQPERLKGKPLQQPLQPPQQQHLQQGWWREEEERQLPLQLQYPSGPAHFLWQGYEQAAVAQALAHLLYCRQSSGQYHDHCESNQPRLQLLQLHQLHQIRLGHQEVPGQALHQAQLPPSYAGGDPSHTCPGHHSWGSTGAAAVAAAAAAAIAQSCVGSCHSAAPQHDISTTETGLPARPAAAGTQSGPVPSERGPLRPVAVRAAVVRPQQESPSPPPPPPPLLPPSLVPGSPGAKPRIPSGTLQDRKPKSFPVALD
jgi:hypothetical protein